MTHLETERTRWLAGAGGRGNGELLFNGDLVAVWEDGKVLEMCGGDGYTAMQIFLKPQNYILKNG